MKQLNNQLSAKSKRLLMLSFLLALLPTTVSAQCPDESHPHMIDLGLPSGTKWACCNVGAEKPEDYGGYFAWGETAEKSSYTEENYLDGKGTSFDIGKDIAGTQYDAATANWGSSWVMPSKEQMEELVNSCTSEWTTENGVNGRRFTGPNGASIFIPGAGNRWGDDSHSAGFGYYWSSTLSEPGVESAHNLWFYSGGVEIHDNGRKDGFSIRPVVAGSSTPSGIAIDATNFPDEYFRNWVQAQDYGQDGVLTEEEIAGVIVIDVSSQNIADLKGIEYFTALTTLDCHYNQLTSLDVSQKSALTELDCAYNQLTSLDVSNNTALTTLDCGYNQLTSLEVSKNVALTRLNCLNNQLTSLDVSHNTALTRLECNINQLTSLDVSLNTALTELVCSNNQLTSLDVTQNTALTDLYCYSNQLASLDVSHNTALTWFNCSSNQLTSLNVLQNRALKWLTCYENQLTSLDVSQNAALMGLESYDNQLTSLDVSGCTTLANLSCHGNQLTSLDVSQNIALVVLDISNNQIKGAGMDALIAGLRSTGGRFYAIAPDDSNEQNAVTKVQVAAAKEKGWTTYYWSFESNEWLEYEGSDPQDITPVAQGETIDIGTEIDSNTDLDGNVVGDVFYSISSGDGSYDPAEGCIVVTKPTDDLAIDGKDIFGEDFKDGFTGIVFKVQAGSGTVKVQAETQGTMTLKVKIGNGAPVEMELEGGKLKVSFPYSVTEDSYVYIYGGSKSAGAKGMNRAPSDGDMLKIYGIEVVSDADGISSIEDGELEMDHSPVYNLNGQRVSEPTKGIYIRNGRKVLIK